MSSDRNHVAIELLISGIIGIIMSLLALVLGAIVVQVPSTLGYSPPLSIQLVYEIFAVLLFAIVFYSLFAFGVRNAYSGTMGYPAIYDWADAVVHQTRLRSVPNAEQWAEEPPTSTERRRLLALGIGLPVAALVFLPVMFLSLGVAVLAAAVLVHLAREDIWPIRPLSWHLALAGIAIPPAFPLISLAIYRAELLSTNWFFFAINWSAGVLAPLGEVGTLIARINFYTLPVSFAAVVFATAYCWVLLYDARNLARESSPRTDASDPTSRIRRKTVLLAMMASGLVSVTLVTWAGAGGSNAAAALVASSGLGALVAFRAEGFPSVLVTATDWLAGIVGSLLGVAVLVAMPLFGATSGMPRADGWWVAFAVVGFVVGTMVNTARTGRRADMETPPAD